MVSSVLWRHITLGSLQTSTLFGCYTFHIILGVLCIFRWERDEVNLWASLLGLVEAHIVSEMLGLNAFLRMFLERKKNTLKLTDWIKTHLHQRRDIIDNSKCSGKETSQGRKVYSPWKTFYVGISVLSSPNAEPWYLW